jgi:hypothetical protein
VTVDWGTLEKLIDDGDVEGVAAAVADLDGKQRKALTKPVRAYPERWRGALAWDSDVDLRNARREHYQRSAPALRVAGAGCLVEPNAVATWLRRRDMWHGDPPVDLRSPLRRVLRARPQQWREELALRMAQRLSRDDQFAPTIALLTVGLVVETGVEPPASFGFALAWLLSVTGGQRARIDQESLLARLRADPLLPAVPRLFFETDELGPHIEQQQGLPDWPAAVATLVGEGRLDRAAVLDGCLGRLLRGGTANAVRAYQQIYDALRVTLDELADRAQVLVRLLPDAPSTVAGLAHAELRRLDQAGRLPTGTLAETSRAVLFRSEKKLATTQLGWIEAVLKRDPGSADELLSTVTVAFGHAAPAIQQRAVALLTKHASRLSAGDREQITLAAVALPADLRTTLAVALGGSTTGAVLPPAGPPPSLQPPSLQPPSLQPPSLQPPSLQPPSLQPSSLQPSSLQPRPFAPAEMPPPVGSPTELAEELAALLESATVGTFNDQVDPVGLERVLAGLVAFGHADRTAVATALAPLLDRRHIQAGLPERLPSYSHSPPYVMGLLLTAVRAAVGPLYPGRPAGWAEQLAQIAMVAAPLRVLKHRLVEIAAGLGTRPVPLLLATPTAVTGRLDPAVLLARLDQAARQGWQPWEYDLQQALLRLPGEVDPAAAAAARRLGTAAGRAMADWVERGGLPAPVIERRAVQRLQDVYTPTGNRQEKVTVLVAVVAEASSPAGAPDGALTRTVLDLPDPRLPPRLSYGRVAWTACWPAVAPSHRDLIAAHLLRPWSPGGYGGQELPSLAEADGPVGAAMNLAIAGGLSADDEAARAATVDGLQTLARRGQLDGAAVGAEIVALVEIGQLKLVRVVPALRDAARSGAQAQVWAAITAALPPLLAMALEKPATGLADLVALATETAPAAAAREPIPELTVYIGRKKGTRLATEAARLDAYLRS